MPTKEECQKKLFYLGLKLGVSPRLIATRLLSEADKEDMLNGLLDDDSLETGVRVWRDNGMPEYSNGSGAIYKPSSDLPMQRYRGSGESV